MLKIGEFNSLTVLRSASAGFYLDGGELEGEIFLPKTDVHSPLEVGDTINVFLSRDAKRNAIATTQEPSIMPGHFGFLTVDRVVMPDRIHPIGALLDWGNSFPLFMPSREFRTRVKADNSYLVYIYYDDVTKQIIATMHTERFLNLTAPTFKMNEEVDILIAQMHERGYKVIINNAFWGMIYESEIFEYVELGMHTKGYIKFVREDGKIDVSLQKQGVSVVNQLDDLILADLNRNNGFIPLSDKSDSDEIADRFGCSKKAFKKAIGVLYKHRHILIEPEGIRLVSLKSSESSSNSNE